LEELRQTFRKGRTSTTTIDRWLCDVRLRDSDGALVVNSFSIEIRNAAVHRLRRVPGLAAPAALHRRDRHTSALARLTPSRPATRHDQQQSREKSGRRRLD
jgi:hypothetical protein